VPVIKILGGLMKEKIEQAVLKIMDDLSDRSGFDLGGLDEEIIEEIKTTWIGLIEKALQ